MINKFIIPCYNSNKKSYINDCVNSIIDTNPRAYITVVDSDSPDKSYIDPLKKKGVEVIEACNKNYDYGAYWIGFLKNSVHVHNYIFIHDSTVIKKPIPETNTIFTPFYWFKNKDNPSLKEHDDWINIQLNRAGLTERPPNNIGIFGPLFMAKPEFMLALKRHGLDKALPTSKWQAVYAGELMIGIAAYNLGIDIQRSAYYGEIHENINAPDKFIWKFSGINEIGRE